MIEYQTKTNHVIAAFLAASVVVHGLFLWQKKTDLHTVFNGEKSLSINIKSTEQVETISHNTRYQDPKMLPDNPVSEKKQSEYENVKTISNNMDSLPTEQQPVEKDVATVTSEKIIFADKEQIQLGIKKLFQANFYYPTIARRNQWQGNIEVSIRIMPDGKLTNIQVIKTSGYSVLDNAAIDTLKTAYILPLAKDWLNGKYFDLVLPIEYRLIDS